MSNKNTIYRKALKSMNQFYSDYQEALNGLDAEFPGERNSPLFDDPDFVNAINGLDEKYPGPELDESLEGFLSPRKPKSHFPHHMFLLVLFHLNALSLLFHDTILKNPVILSFLFMFSSIALIVELIIVFSLLIFRGIPHGQ